VKAPTAGQRLTLFLLSGIARLPLSMLHALGSVAGALAFRFSGSVRNRMLDNIAIAGVAGDNPAEVRRFASRSAREHGTGLLEVLPFWRGRAAEMVARTRTDASWDQVKAMAEAGRGVIFLTPHLGCFEAAGQFLSQHLPITVMYRPPRLEWLDPLLRDGRAQGQARITTADSRGVRASLKALKNGEPIGLLPDQVPVQGGGVMADFFGKPAYTTTLVGKLQKATGAPIVLVCAERLPRAAGYALTFHPLPAPLPSDETAGARALNASLEAIIRRCPEQYLWTYNRYKQPASTPPPPANPGATPGG
jgi:KDO2-lipid IV(A) lauroyltransferase